MSENEILQNCLELKIPIFMKVPPDSNLWAIDENLHKLTERDVILSEKTSFIQRDLQIDLNFEFTGDLYAPPKVNTSTLAASTLVRNCEYVQLFDDDIAKLINASDLTIKEFQSCVFYNEENKLVCETTFTDRQYLFEPNEKKRSESIYLFQKNSGGFARACSIFKLYPNHIKYDHTFNFPLNKKETLISNEFNLFINDADLSKLIFNNPDYVLSDYHLESKYHASTDFLKLSEAGFILFHAGKKSISGGASGYLSRQSPFFLSKGNYEGGAFWINPESKNKQKEKGCRFSILKNTFNKYWGEHTTLNKEEIKKINELVIQELDFHTNESYAKAGAKIILPDIFKNKRKELKSSKSKVGKK